MAVEVVSDKVELKVSAKRLWKAAFEETHEVLPKAAPDVVESIELEGSFAPGAIRTLRFQESYAKKVSEEKHPDKVVLLVKEKLLEVDPNAFFLKVEIVEGGFVGILVKHYKASFHVDEIGPSSCSVSWTFEYEPISDEYKAFVPPALKEAVLLGFFGVEKYLLSNPEN